MFQLIFLGTSAGVPTKYRNVSALAIECVNNNLSGSKQHSQSKRPWVLVDCGEGTQQQLLQTKLSVIQLAVICITHVHGDHCYGLPGLLASMSMSGRTDKLTLIAPKAIAKFLDALSMTTELYFSFPITFIAIEDHLKDSALLSVDFSPYHNLLIDITELSHRVPSYGFSLTQTLKTRQLNTNKLNDMGVAAGPIWGRLQNGEDVILNKELADKTGMQTLMADDFVDNLTQFTKMVVAGDNDNPSLLTEAVKGAALLVHEATYTQKVTDAIIGRPDGFNPMHTTAKKIASFAELAHIPNLILTHFSARYQPFDDPESKTTNMADIRLEAQQYYQGNLWLAKDFMRFVVNEKVEEMSNSVVSKGESS